jgi:flagellar basal body-associated protein FliL
MDERTLKRLLKILAVSLIAIFLLKMGITRTYTHLNKVAAEKKQAAAVKSPSPQPEPAPVEGVETPASPAAGEAAADVSASPSVVETHNPDTE